MTVNVQWDNLLETLAELAPYNQYAAAWLVRLKLAESDEARDEVIAEMTQWIAQIAASFDDFAAKLLEWAENLTRVGGPT